MTIHLLHLVTWSLKRMRHCQLEFFFNRPTLVALIGFGLNLSAAYVGSSVPDEEKNLNEDLSDNEMKIKDSGDTFVKGLLGYGKGRALFCLNVNVDSVIVCLNKEDGSQLAMFVQESFVLDLKVHLSSLSLEDTLGNFRLCDLSLGSEHYWAWLCDIRNQEAESLIQASQTHLDLVDTTQWWCFLHSTHD